MSEVCKNLHELFNSIERYSFPFDDNKIPLNGIYILFEEREKGHGKDRIVRIGTHTGKDQLRSRLWQHFMNENKDRSIFRKNIGRALLNKINDNYLKIWELDLTTKENKEKFSNLIDKQKQNDIEKEVSRYIRNNFSFVVFEIEDKDERLKLESEVISAISLCEECGAGDNWLGKSSPKEKIRKSGLWLVNELYKKPLDEKGFDFLKEIVRDTY